MNLQTALRILLLSFSFTTNAQGPTAPPKLLSSEVVGNGVTRYTELPPLNNWNEAAAFCADMGEALATKAQVCPGGQLVPPVGGTLEGKNWVAVANGSNNWLQVGNSGPLCKTHKDDTGTHPLSWGEDNAKETYESNYVYCYLEPKPPSLEPTSLPTSSPTTFIERVEAVVGDGCKNGIDFVTSFTTETEACDKVTFCDGSTSNSIFNPNVENVCIDFTKADEECTNFNVVTTFDNAWRMSFLSLTSSGMGAETDPEQVVMKGSNDMNTWVELYNSPLVFTERKKPKEFYFANNDMFKYYSLTFERNENSSKMHIGHYGLVEVYTKSCSIQFFEGISGFSFDA